MRVRTGDPPFPALLMPTPFMHLDFAERLRVHPLLVPAVRQRLEREWPAFYLGNIAADYQIICDIPRKKTHFYSLPPERDRQAHEVMLANYPGLAKAGQLSPAHAAFVAGYCFHLIQDLVWYRCVLEPFFFRSDVWPPERRVRFIAHNILLAHLDQHAYHALPESAGSLLGSAISERWLPFANDREIHRWRDLISKQLQPGAGTETVAIYASRLKMTTAEFARNLNNPCWMNEQVFAKVPLGQVEAALDAGIERSVLFINEYLASAVSAAAN